MLSDKDVTLQQASPRGLATVRARIPASGIVAYFRAYLDQVYAAGRTGTPQLDGQNIFVYRDVQGAPDQLDALGSVRSLVRGCSPRMSARRPKVTSRKRFGCNVLMTG